MKSLPGNIVLCLSTLLTVSGCASILDGSQQTLSVRTVAGWQQVASAQCIVDNNKGTWYVTTPGTVTVHRSYDALNIACHKPGYQGGIATVDSSTKGMAFGNLIFGGVIGAGVDMGTGAAYDYPSLVTVPMGPADTASTTGTQSASAQSRQPTS